MSIICCNFVVPFPSKEVLRYQLPPYRVKVFNPDLSSVRVFRILTLPCRDSNPTKNCRVLWFGFLLHQLTISKSTAKVIYFFHITKRELANLNNSKLYLKICKFFLGNL